MSLMNFELPEVGYGKERSNPRTWSFLGLAALVMIWLAVSPMPGWLLGRFLVLGAIVGVLWSVRSAVSRLAGLGVMVVGFPEIRQAAWKRVSITEPGWHAAWDWQALAVAWTMVGIVVSATFLFRRLHRQVSPEDGSSR